MLKNYKINYLIASVTLTVILYYKNSFEIYEKSRSPMARFFSLQHSIKSVSHDCTPHAIKLTATKSGGATLSLRADTSAPENAMYIICVIY